MAKFKLKVGDVVLIRVRVDRIDPKDDFTPYQAVDLEGSITRFGDHQVVEVVEGARGAEEPPEPDHPLRAGERLTVGDKVMHRRRRWLGEGEIIKDDHTGLPYTVRWHHGSISTWLKSGELIRAPQFRIGDSVSHTFKPEWGHGVVREIVDLAKQHYRMYDYFGGDEPELRECSWLYTVEFDQYIPSVMGPVNIWHIAEENIRSVKWNT